MNEGVLLIDERFIEDLTWNIESEFKVECAHCWIIAKNYKILECYSIVLNIGQQILIFFCMLRTYKDHISFYQIY